MSKPQYSFKKLATSIFMGSATLGLSVVTQAQVLEEVTVTAQKRTESLQDVPISLSVVNGNSLEEMGISDFTELKNQVPNFYVQDTPGNYAIYIRGVGSNPGSLSLEQTVGMFVDGVYAGHGRQFQSPFLDIERIEVLRGPQGALVGKNTSAGAINIITRKPTDEFEASINADYEFKGDAFSTTGVISGPLSDTLFGRVAGNYLNSDGFMNNIGMDAKEASRDDYTVRGTLVWDATDAMELTTKYENSKSNIDGSMYKTKTPSEGINYTRNTNGIGGIVVKPTQDYNDTNAQSFTLTANYDLDDYTITSITGYSEYDYQKLLDSDFTYTPPNLISTFEEDFSQWSEELRLVSAVGEKFDYVVGLYYQTDDYKLEQTTTFTRPDIGVVLSDRPFKQDHDVWSTYAQFNYRFTDTVRASASLRYTNDQKNGRQTTYTNEVPIVVLSDKLNENEVDSSINFQWDVSDSVMLYAGYADGSKAGGFNGGQSSTTENNFKLDPESAETYEAGAKTYLLDDTMTFNVAIYRTKYSDLQVSENIPGTVSFIAQNAGSATTQGVETDLAWAISDGLTLNAGLAYLDAEYDKFVGANCLWNNPGCDLATNDIGGTKLPKTAEWSGYMNLSYEHPIANNLMFQADLGLTYSDDRYLLDTLDPQGRQNAFTKYDLRLAVGDADDRWNIAVVGKNLTDKTTFSAAFETPLHPGYYSYLVDPPRTITLQLQYNFF